MSAQPTPEVQLHTRLRVLKISPELFLQLFAAGDHAPYRVIKNAVPDGTTVLNVRLGWPTYIEVLLESDSFSPVPVGDEVPELPTPHIERLAWPFTIKAESAAITVGDPPWGRCTTVHYMDGKTPESQLLHERIATCCGWTPTGSPL